jgi:hypothetical protein
MITYIRKSIKGYYIEFPEEIDSKYWEGKIGSTYEDFLNDKWIHLSDEQVVFHKEHPEANISQVIVMELPEPYVRTLDEAKHEKIREIEDYDRSEAVNSFTIGNQTMWLTVSERQQLATQISSNEAIGRDTMTRWFNGNEFTYPIASWKQMLVALEVYAGDALNVTEAHKAVVNALNDIESVDNFDITVGYPEKLSF